MPPRFRLQSWSQRVGALIVAIVFAIGWWLEQNPSVPPQQQPSQRSDTTRPQSTGIPPGQYRVLRVVDGDTLLLEKDRARVRLQGIDTPETVKEGTPVQPWGIEATEFTKNFVSQAGKNVRIEIDGEPVDQYGRALVFVWHQGKLLNEELVREGLAKAKLGYDYSNAMKQRLRRAQDDARKNRRGIWSE